MRLMAENVAEDQMEVQPQRPELKMSFAMKARGVSGGSAAFGSKTCLTLASYGSVINLKAFAHQW